MRWFRRQVRQRSWVHDGITRNHMSAYWWEPGCKCHWDAGVYSDYCDHCKSKHRALRPTDKP